MGNLSLRIISGLVMVTVALTALFTGGYIWSALIALLGIMLAVEWVVLVGLTYTKVSGLLLSLCITGLAFTTVHFGYPVAIWMILGATTLAMVSLLLFKSRTALWLGVGIVYIGCAVVALIWLRSVPLNQGLIITLWLLLAVWASDIFAYFAGKSIGGPKFLPTISPKKTWAGFVGALFGAALVAIGVYYGFELKGSPVSLIIVSIAVSILSQAGDALESALKRSLDVKDSGSLIPGHGGFFDRLDGLLVAAPVVAFALLISDNANL